MMQEDYNPILLYKPRGEYIVNFPNIEPNDYLLGIATETQIELLKLYGEKCIMLDSTHGTNQHKFYLTTILVNDKDHEGLPVAFLFSSKISSEHFEAFFESIKAKLPDLKTNVLMSDDTNTFINAWKKVFNDEAKHLLCSWHIKRSVHRNLIAKVKNPSMQQMKNDLNKIIEELDKCTFYRHVEDFFIKYKEEKNFLDYFQLNYLNRPEKWAYCHRLNLGINVNMKLEQWHKQLKHEEAGGTKIKRLDKALNIVMNSCTKRLLGRLISIERGKLTKRVQLIRQRHSTKMDENIYSIIQLDENKYVIWYMLLLQKLLEKVKSNHMMYIWMT